MQEERIDTNLSVIELLLAVSIGEGKELHIIKEIRNEILLKPIKLSTP